MTNEGLLLPGDYHRVLTTSLNGNLAQTALGTYGVDLDLELVTADRIDVTGTAAVSGAITVNLIDPYSTARAAKPGTHDNVVVGTVGGETHPGLVLVAPNTAVSTYSLQYLNGTDIVRKRLMNDLGV